MGHLGPGATHSAEWVLIASRHEAITSEQPDLAVFDKLPTQARLLYTGCIERCRQIDARRHGDEQLVVIAATERLLLARALGNRDVIEPNPDA